MAVAGAPYRFLVNILRKTSPSQLSQGSARAGEDYEIKVNTMKVLKVVAWVGIGVMVGALTFAFFVCISPPMVSEGWVLLVAFATLPGILGVLLVLIGGFVSKPRYLWIASIIVGALFVSSFYCSAHHGLLTLVLFTSPGLVCIIGGIVMGWLSHRGKA